MNKLTIKDKTKIIDTIEIIKQDVINTRNKIMYRNSELINMYINLSKEKKN